ncbi:MAG: hypothetical protein GKR91_01375 [Pseudomonadales bacterium]|nr:hypothetical protein [Pseudomonadales bacterium]
MVSELERTMQAKRRRMIQTTNFLLFLTMCAFVVFRFIQLGLSHPPYPAIMCAILTLANSMYLYRNGSLKIACGLMAAALLFGLGASSMNNGAFAGPTVLLGTVFPILAVLLVSSLAGWIAMGLVMAILSLLFVLELNGQILPSPLDEQGLLIARFLAIVSTVSIGTWVAVIFAKYQQELIQIINNQANTDHLTGLANRRALAAALLQETGRARRNDTYL